MSIALHLIFFRRALIFLGFFLKKNELLSVWNSLEGLQLYYEETPTQVFSCEYSKTFRDTFFYRTTPVAAFELSFSIREELKKKESGEIAFALTSFGSCTNTTASK